MDQIEKYISKNLKWKDELLQLRAIMLKSGMTETVKWGIPTYTVLGKNVAGLGAFKNYVAIWFFNGVFLKDDHEVLINAQKDKTRGLRQWRFESIDEIDKNLILEYAREAIDNQKAGKEIKPVKNKLKMPAELKKALIDHNLENKFQKLSEGKRKEYAEYISEAKQEKTKIRRIEKCLPLIEKELGLNDKYRKN